jgi:hypothetical protein
VSLPILKSASKNCVAADSEINSQELRRYQFRGRQLRTVMLPIRRSAIKKCVAADSEIGSDGGVIWALLLSLSLSLSLSLFWCLQFGRLVIHVIILILVYPKGGLILHNPYLG